tara:strand:+ start:3464 stop:4339 length:876 start_codon:yes stop_codon:yes gene_type:complete
MVENPLISIIIPVFNREKLIVRTLESVQNQTYTNWECVIVDDGSSDNTLNVIASFIDRDKRFQIISHHHVGNANILRNIGINKAKGKYIAMLDSDDEFMPNHLSRRLSKIEEWGCDGIVGSCLLNDGKQLTEKKVVKLNLDNILNELLSGKGVAPTPSHFYKTKCFKKLQWDENLLRHQDYDLIFRFQQLFYLKSDPKPTIIVNYDNHSSKMIDFKSCIGFLEKQKNNINEEALGFYSMNMLIRSVRLGANKKIVNYYKKNLLLNNSQLPITVRILSRFPIMLNLWSKIRS